MAYLLFLYFIPGAESLPSEQFWSTKFKRDTTHSVWSIQLWLGQHQSDISMSRSSCKKKND